jgi:hypothetical protein
VQADREGIVMSVVGPPQEAAGDAEGSPEPRRRAPAIRPFLLTTGRVSAGGTGLPMPVEAQVAELAAGLRLHLNVVRVLVEDLRAAGHLAVHRPNAAIAQDLSVLRRVINGLRAVPDSRDTLRDTS